jgi:predicted cupin superfamily sugar epimerase
LLSAAEVIRRLELKPHPEGGHFRETFRDLRTVDGERAASTAIYFLLARGERSHWHRIDAVEVGTGMRARHSLCQSRAAAKFKHTNLVPDLSLARDHKRSCARTCGKWR